MSLSSLYSVEGRIAVITGGGTGIGFWIAEGLVQNGAKVYITGRREHVLKDAAEKLNAIGSGKAFFFVTDVTKADDIQRLVKFVEKEEKVVDILVNNAGIAKAGPQVTHLDSISDLQAGLAANVIADWNTQFSTNTWAPFMVTVSFLHLLAKASAKGEGRGSVIMISSGAARIWNPFFTAPAYTASKAGIEQLTSVLAAKLYPHGIRVNTISPGSFPSEMNPPEFEGAMSNPKNNVNIPLKRSGVSDDIVGATIFFASKASAYVTGQRIDVDGGLMLIANGLTAFAP